MGEPQQLPEYTALATAHNQISTNTSSGKHLDVKAVAVDDPRLAPLLEEHLVTYSRLFQVLGDPAPPDPADFVPPRGNFFLATLRDSVDGESVGCEAWRRVPPSFAASCSPDVAVKKAVEAGHVAEIKRMFTRPMFQRKGFASTVLHALEHDAREAGIVLMVLETGFKQTQAMALYEKNGYRSMPWVGHYGGAEWVRTFGGWLVD